MQRTGAHSVGFTGLKDYHLYSHKGRGANAGKAIQRIHENAIAITVEMDHEMMQSAPQGSSVMESSEQYLRSGVLALKLAAYIREMGYEATAHIDGNYEVICPAGGSRCRSGGNRTNGPSDDTQTWAQGSESRW